MSKLELIHLDARRVEIKLDNKYGLAVNKNGTWEVSPNFSHQANEIIKKIQNAEIIIVSNEPKEPTKEKTVKKNKKNKKADNV